jgi:hypothetical protein
MRGQRFERHGLILNRSSSATLGDLFALHEPTIADRAEATQDCYALWYRRMKEFFGKQKRLEDITKGDAERFRSWCLSERSPRLAVTTFARGVKTCRTIFQFGVDSELIIRNPFYKVRGGSDVNLLRQGYVERSRVLRIVEACRTDEDRFALLLARFAGLRIPNEIRPMRFGDFKEDRFIVNPETKTGRREVPFFFELHQVFERLKQGRSKEDYVFSRSYIRHGNYRHRILSAIVRSGEKKWEKLFINLRSSCITDFVMLGCNDKTLDSIFGNSSFARFRHYVQFLKDYEIDRLLRDNFAIVETLKAHGGQCDNIREIELCTRNILAENSHKEVLVKLFGLTKSE